MNAKLWIGAVVMCVLSPGLPLAAQQTGASRPKPVSEMEQMQRVEDSWSAAVVKKDQYALELVLSPSLVDISARGEVTTRNQQIAQLFQISGAPLGLDQKVASVRILGEVAVVSGTYVLRHRENNQLIDEKGVFSHVFQHVRGNWMCINSQRTSVLEESPQKAKAAGKKSNSELPFHIPLFHKGDAPAQPQATEPAAPAPQNAPAPPAQTPQS